MAVAGAGKRIDDEVRSWPDVVSGEHRFGGIEYRVGTREIGHRHGNALVDIPFPMRTRNELVSSGQASAHHIYPGSGWISVHISGVSDVDKAIGLLRKSYDIAVENNQRREQTHNSQGRRDRRED